MALEIERKFICNLTYEQAKKLAYNSKTIISIYLERTPSTVFRVVKETNRQGISSAKTTRKITTQQYLVREEFEQDISVILFDAIIQSEYPLIEKERFLIKHNDSYWEVDFFKNYDFVIAELEFKNTKEAKSFTDLPPWVVKEVTEDSYYLNCNLASVGNK